MTKPLLKRYRLWVFLPYLVVAVVLLAIFLNANLGQGLPDLQDSWSVRLLVLRVGAIPLYTLMLGIIQLLRVGRLMPSSSALAPAVWLTTAACVWLLGYWEQRGDGWMPLKLNLREVLVEIPGPLAVRWADRPVRRESAQIDPRHWAFLRRAGKPRWIKWADFAPDGRAILWLWANRDEKVFSADYVNALVALRDDGSLDASFTDRQVTDLRRVDFDRATLEILLSGAFAPVLTGERIVLRSDTRDGTDIEAVLTLQGQFLPRSEWGHLSGPIFGGATKIRGLPLSLPYRGGRVVAGGREPMNVDDRTERIASLLTWVAPEGVATNTFRFRVPSVVMDRAKDSLEITGLVDHGEHCMVFLQGDQPMIGLVDSEGNLDPRTVLLVQTDRPWHRIRLARRLDDGNILMALGEEVSANLVLVVRPGMAGAVMIALNKVTLGTKEFPQGTAFVVPGPVAALGPRGQVLVTEHESGKLLLYDASSGKQKAFTTPDWVRTQ